MDADFQAMSNLALAQASAPQLAGRLAGNANIDKASQDFEGMFVTQMLQPMFETVPVDSLFGGGHGEEMMRSFLVQEYGKIVAKNSHFGIAAAVKNEMIKAQQIADTKNHPPQTDKMPPFNKAPSGPIAKNKPDLQSGPAQVVKRIIALIDELVQVMKREPALVEKRRLKEHAELLKRKQRLAIDYRASVRSLAMQPDFLKQLPEDLREAARAAAKRLADASDTNAKVLRAAITALQRLIQTIIGIVKDEVLPKGGYANTKSVQMVPGLYSPTCKPVAVSRTA